MKKTISIILAALMLLSCISVFSASAASTASISAAGKTISATVGGTFKYSVKATAPELVENGQFTVYYPMDILEIQDYHFPFVDDAVKDIAVVSNYANLKNEFRFNFSNVEGYDFTKSAGLVTLEFKVKAAGTGSIELSKQLMCNKNSVNIISNISFTEAASASSPVKLSTTSKKLAAGKAFTLSVKNTKSKVKFASTKSKIAKVASNGKVTALQKGTAYIKATVDGKTLKCKVQVTSSPKLSKSKVSVKKGKTVTVTLSGKASAIKNVYTNTKIAKITSAKTATKIKVRGLKKGTTTLSVKVNGVKVLKLKVTVKK